MDELIDQLTQLTNDFVQRLNLVTEEEIIRFLDQRESMIERMKLNQLSDADRIQFRSRVLDIVEQDKQILYKLNLMREEAISGISKLDEGKRQKSAYDTYYPVDSIYFDRKK